METDTVHANPLVNDTTGDGVTNIQERRLGTDPKSRDTTGDGVPDAEAAGGDYDPTLFDIDSPEITVTYATSNGPDADADLEDPVDVDWSNGKLSFTDPVDASVRVSGSYEVDFVVSDPAGLDEARGVRDDDVEETVSLSGQRDGADVEFDIGTVDTFTDSFAGSRVTVRADDRHGVVDGIGTTEAAAVEVSGVWAAASEEIRSQGVSDPQIERDLGTLLGMTIGAGESIDSMRALYNDPVGTITAVRAIPGALRNLDAIIAAMPESIEAQQRHNNPHDPDENPRLYESYREGWYEGYIAWFVIESAIPAGKAGKALKSSKRVQKTVDKLGTSRVRRAARLAGQASDTAKAPVRYGKLQFSRGLSTGIGVTKKTGERILSPVPTVGKQYRMPKHLNRQNIDGEKLDHYSSDEQRKIGEFTNRHGDSGAEIATEGGPVFQQIVATDTLDAATTDRLIRAYDQHIIDEDDIQRIARGLDEGDIDQQAVETVLVRTNNIEANGHSVDCIRTAHEVNGEYGPDYQDPYAPETLTVEYTTQSQEQFVRVHGSDNQARAWMMQEHEIEDLTADEIKAKFSLSEEPTYVSDVNVPEGTSVRTGTVAENFDGERGATQFELQDRIDSENFHNQRKLPQ